MNKVVLVTGASSGMGKATARLLVQSGYRLYCAARRLDKMDDLRSLGAVPIALDVTDDSSLRACIQTITEQEGRLDILVNSAGFGSHGAIEEVPIEDARYQLEVNVFGAMRLVQLALPLMRAQGFGKIVNLSSVGGKLAGPLGGWYHASKFALEGLSDSLRLEVKDFGIDVILIEPGAIASEWGAIANANLLKTSGHGPYRPMAEKFSAVIRDSEAKATDPQAIAELIKKAVQSRRPKARYAKGHLARPILLVKSLTSDRMMDWIITRQFK